MVSVAIVILVVFSIFAIGWIITGSFQMSESGGEIIGGVVPPKQTKTCVTGTVTATSGVSYDNYKIYSNLGVDGVRAVIVIKDKFGNTVDTQIINQGDSYDSSATGLAIKVTSVRALPDGTVVGVDLSVTSFVTGTVTATSGVSYGNYKVYSDLGVSNAQARIVIKNKSSKTVDTQIINQGDSYDSSVAGLTIKVISVRALTDGTILGVDLHIKATCK